MLLLMLAYAKCGIVESLNDRAEGGIPRRFALFLIIFPVYGKNHGFGHILIVKFKLKCPKTMSTHVY